MCTAISFSGLFGRTLDHHEGYGEQVALSPRKLPLSFRRLPAMGEHYALLGMATVEKGVPLYYDGFNEKGLFMAGLLFAENAVYLPRKEDHYNVTPFELIPWILGQCPDLRSAKALLTRVNLWAEPFSENLPLSPLHWLIADRTGALTLEPTAKGLWIYENPMGVLTNNPPFPYHMTHLTDYLQLSPQYPADRLTQEGILRPYSRGMGAMGLPGDWSSASRFVRIAFAKEHQADDNISAFFHLMDTVAVPKGAALSQEGAPIITRYTCCCDPARGKYYYTTHQNRRITAVPLEPQGSALSCFPLHQTEDILYL